MRCAGGLSVIPSHQTSPSSVSAMLVKMQFLLIVCIALGLDCAFVPGATPKNPASGLMARSVPSGAFLIQAMSSPTVSDFPAFKPLRRHQHGEIGLAAGAREGGAEIGLLAVAGLERP